MARKRKTPVEAGVEASLVPILSILFLLVPALLLAMEVARFAAIDVSPPRWCGFRSHAVTTVRPLHLKVFIREDGYRVAAGREDLPFDAPTIPLTPPRGSLGDLDRYDYAKLEAEARDLKRSFPHETIVTVSAEGDIPYYVLVRTLDALRGRDCRLWNAGEEVPRECMFFHPIVQS